MMTRQQAIDAYNRSRELEKRQSEQLRLEILVPVFGGCCCRQHNCRVNWEMGICETPDNPKEHMRQAKLSKEYDYRQRKIWDFHNRIQSVFAKYF